MDDLLRELQREAAQRDPLLLLDCGAALSDVMGRTLPGQPRDHYPDWSTAEDRERVAGWHRAMGAIEVCLAPGSSLCASHSLLHLARAPFSLQAKLGGGEGTQGVYGSIRGRDTWRIFDCLRVRCGMGRASHLLDVGAGLGRPLVHAVLQVGVAGALGVEFDRVKCDKAGAFLARARDELLVGGAAAPAVQWPVVQLCAVEAMRTLGLTTHVYSFWESIDTHPRLALGALVQRSPAVRGVAVVQRHERIFDLDDLYGFGPFSLVGSFSVHSCGAGRRYHAYVFRRGPPL